MRIIGAFCLAALPLLAQHEGDKKKQFIGDPKAGEELFWGKADCGRCHAVQGRGGRLGPDLSNIGGVRALPQLYQSLVDPDAEISPGYQGAQVLLKNAKTLRGVARNRTNYS